MGPRRPPGYEVNAGSNPVKVHTFATAGSHAVRLRVTDDRGAVAGKGVIVKVS